MKKILTLFLVGFCLVSCWNEKIEYDDYDTKSIYFPYQYPVRTLSLGNDVIDNSLDRQHKFNIGVCVGGYYNRNKQDWTVNFMVDESLVGTNLYNVDGLQLKALPAEYYTLNPSSSVVIPEGSFSGLIEVQLTDAFFEDPEAILGTYVIPLKITSVQEPAVLLAGEVKEGVADPDPHNPEDWKVTPMDYTLFGVKYVNKYHGSWLRRGAQIVRNQSGEIVDEYRYHGEYVEYDEVVTLTTTALNSFETTLNIKDEEWTLEVTADDDENMTVVSSEDSPVTVTYGAGHYKENADTWGGTPEDPTPRDAIYLNYFYERQDGNVCEISDTLVFRDRGIVFENERPTIQ